MAGSCRPSGWGTRGGSRAQLAIEFVVLMGVSILILAVYLALASDIFGKYSEEKAQAAIERQGFALQREVLLASIVHDGYARRFTIPESIDGFNYTLEATPGYLTLTYRRATITYPIPNATGNLTKGIRTITKQGGVIRVS